MDRLEEAKDRYLNQWTHCGKMLHAQNSQITCECGQTWVWAGTLGGMMEHLEVLEQVTTQAGVVAVPVQVTAEDSDEVGFSW